MFNPEEYFQRVAKKQEKQPISLRNPENLKNVLAKARAANRIDQINPDSFIDLYGKKSVQAEKLWAEGQDEFHERNNTPKEKWHKDVADILEAILHHQIEANNYFGENAWTFKTCAIDDYKNGVDSIVEIRHPEQHSATHTGFAMDVTSAGDPERLTRKVERILNNIQRGELAKIKYFQSEFLNFRGEKNNIPLFVIGCDIKHTEQLADLWYNEEQDTLAEHPIQVLLLKQIMQQARLYRDFAEQHNQPKIAAIYDQTLQEFVAIAKERQTIIDKIIQNQNNKQFFAEDVVSNNLEEIIKNYV